MREDNLCGAGARSRYEKFQPFPGQERQVAAEYQVPFAMTAGIRRVLQRRDDAAQRAFSRPAIIDERDSQVRVLSTSGYNRNAVRATPEQLRNVQEK